jgi:hypothetical protein
MTLNVGSQFERSVSVSDQARAMWRNGLGTFEIAKTLRDQGQTISESMVCRIVCPKGERR